MTIAAFTYKMFSVTAEGFAVDEDVPVDVTSDGDFKIELPHYVATIVGKHMVFAATLRDTIDAYAAACEQYQRARLKGGKPVLLVHATGDKEFGLKDKSVFVGLSYVPDTEVDGRLLKYEPIRKSYTIISDTAENRAKLDALISSMKIAVQMMIEFTETSDPVKYLHEIQFGQPVSAEIAQFTGDWKPEELPVVSNEDDDL